MMDMSNTILQIENADLEERTLDQACLERLRRISIQYGEEGLIARDLLKIIGNIFDIPATYKPIR